jgi:hypothetical protein
MIVWCSDDAARLHRSVSYDELFIATIHHQFVLMTFYDYRTKLRLRFLMSPKELIGENWLTHVTFNKNKLVGEIGHQRVEIDEENFEVETLPCQLLLKAVGYKSLPLENIPFDSKTHVVANENGRVILNGGVMTIFLYITD